MHSGASAAVPCIASSSSVDDPTAAGAAGAAARGAGAADATGTDCASASTSTSDGESFDPPYDPPATAAERSSAEKIPISELVSDGR